MGVANCEHFHGAMRSCCRECLSSHAGNRLTAGGGNTIPPTHGRAAQLNFAQAQPKQAQQRNQSPLGFMDWQAVSTKFGGPWVRCRGQSAVCVCVCWAAKRVAGRALKMLQTIYIGSGPVDIGLRRPGDAIARGHVQKHVFMGTFKGQ